MFFIRIPKRKKINNSIVLTYDHNYLVLHSKSEPESVVDPELFLGPILVSYPDSDPT
jgi:hypothetical protein